MKKIHAFSFILLLLRIYYIKNDNNSTQKIYILDNLSNLQCFTSNYTTTFSGITNSNTPIKSKINFSFTIQDLEKTSHSVKCTIFGEENTLRRMNEFEEDTAQNDDEESNDESNRNVDESSIESIESEEQSDAISSTILQTTIINKNETHNSSETTIKTTVENKTNAIILTNEETEEDIESDEYEDESSNEPESSPSTSHIRTTNITKKTIPIQTTMPLNPIKIQTTTPLKPDQRQTTAPLKPTTIQIQTTMPLKPTQIKIQTTTIKKEIKTTIPKKPVQIQTTTIKKEIKTTIPKKPVQIQTTTIKEEIITTTPKQPIKIQTTTIREELKTTIPKKYIESTIPLIPKTQNVTEAPTQIEIDDEFIYKYNIICHFEEEIKKNFLISVDQNMYFSIDEKPEDANIYYKYPGQRIYNISRCALVKNIFKQVSSFNLNESEKKITFLFISDVLGKIEKDEKVEVDILLIKNNQTSDGANLTENKRIICTSKNEVEPIENEETLCFYTCEVNGLENPSDYVGLIFSSSADVNKIVDDENLKDPAKTDELIKEGKVQNYSLIVFRSISIDSENCQENGIFKIKGYINRKIENSLTFKVNINSNNNTNIMAECSVPIADKGELNITCTVEKNFYDSYINFPHIIVTNSQNEPLLNITQISDNNKSTCKILQESTIITIRSTIIGTSINTIINTKFVDTNIIFRQISHLEINSVSNKIQFKIIAFTFNDLQKNSYLPVTINLIDSTGESKQTETSCLLNKDIDGNNSYLTPLCFDCEVNYSNGNKEYTDVMIVSSSLIKNIPTGSLSYAKKTDSLIYEGSQVDYIVEKNFYTVPPLLSHSVLNEGNCNIDGIFEITSFVNSPIEKILYFYLEFPDSNNNNIKARCKLPISEANKYITIQCNTLSKFSSLKIIINERMIYGADDKELFYLNGFESKNYVSCGDNSLIKYEEAEKKLNAIYVFRQVCKFKKEGKKYKFFLATIIKSNINSNEKLSFTVELKSETNEKSSYKRRLSRREEQIVECSIKSKTNVNENGLGTAGWDCLTGESNIDDASGLDVMGSDDISGIPDDPSLIDPALTDQLIEQGEIKDYSIEENLNELLPIFQTLAIDYSLCKQNGSFLFKGNATSTIKQDVVFNITLTYPESIFACRLPRTLKGAVINIECFSREYFENSTIIVEETIIRDGYNEFFILRNVTSGQQYVTCTSSENQVTKNEYQNGFNTISRVSKSGSSGGGIGVGGIVAISIVGVVVLVGLAILYSFIKRKTKKKSPDDNAQQETSTTNEVSSTFTFY